MTELSLIKQQIDMVKKEMELNVKSSALEFERISKAFSQMGNLLDLLYLEVSVLIETLQEMEIINPEEFQNRLEETAKRVEKQMANQAIADGNLPVQGPN